MIAGTALFFIYFFGSFVIIRRWMDDLEPLRKNSIHPRPTPTSTWGEARKRGLNWTTHAWRFRQSCRVGKFRSFPSSMSSTTRSLSALFRQLPAVPDFSVAFFFDFTAACLRACVQIEPPIFTTVASSCPFISCLLLVDNWNFIP